jgi:hypothetical protein
MGKNDDFIDGFGLGFHDECDYLNPGLSEFLREMNEIILPEIKFTEVIQQSSDDLNRKK